MNLFDTLKGWLGIVVGEATPETGAPPATPTTQEPLTTTTVAALRAMLDEHDRGYFLRSALLADLLRRDADIYGALQQRLTKLHSHPIEFHPEDDSTAAQAAAEDLEDRWSKILPTSVRWDLDTDSCLMGFGLGQMVYEPDDETGQLWPRVEPWPAWAVEYIRVERQWYVHTLGGRLPITPGDGQWVMHAPRSKRAPFLWGAIRPTAEWSLRTSYSASDASKLGEVHGSPVWKVSLPAGARETPDGKSFIRSVRGIGRNAVIPVPKGRTPEESYDIDIVQAQTDAYLIFDFLMRVAGGRIRLAILGQDLTSQNAKVGTNASSKTGENVTDDLIESEARALTETYTDQIAAPIARYLGAPPVRVEIDAEPEADAEADAAALGAEADALAKWKGLGVNVDAKAIAMERGLPVLADLPAPKTPPTPQQPPPAAPPSTPPDPNDSPDAEGGGEE